MIKIEVRQNEKFELGFPYNSSVDSYFQNLSVDYIKNYGLDESSVIEINNHKNKTLQFDKDLHEFIFKLSAFIVGFETTGQILIDEFDELISVRDELKTKLKKMSKDQHNANDEYDFVLSNIEKLQNDIDKVIDFIQYYQGQVIDDTYTYNDTYIEDTESELALIEDIITQNETDFEYYHNTLKTHIQSMVVIKDELLNRNFVETSLRLIYEEWQKRHEEYYQNLVTYFADEYNQYWTYGSSLMFGQKLNEERASTTVYKSIADRWQQSLFKKFNFTIEKEIKEYSLQWLDNNPTFEPDDFMYSIAHKKVEILKREILLVEQIIINKKQALRSVIPYEKEQNYFRYREIVLARRKYKIDNVGGIIDQTVIDDYDNQLLNLLSDYDFVVSKYSQPTYWDFYADWEMYTELLTDLNRQLDKAERTIIRDFRKDTPNNEEFLRKIEFYTNEKIDLEKKLDELVEMKEKLEIENNLSNDALSLLSSRLYENTTLITQKRNEYILFFDERIPFFTQHITESELDGIVELLDGNYFRDFDEGYNDFLNYTCGVEWYSEIDRDNLKIHYGKMMEIIENNIQTEWNREFSHQILDTKKIDIYDYYLDKEVRLLYALVNKHLLEGKYDNGFIQSINTQSVKVKEIFSTFVEIAFDIEMNITVKTNAFDYDDTFEFTISDGNETKENVLKTFFDILDGIVTFAYNKNIEFKVFEKSVDEMEKIDQVWLDMEKRYV